jgi:hypothetical protein
MTSYVPLDFCQNLLLHGIVELDLSQSHETESSEPLNQLIVQAERRLRADAPDQAPVLDLQASLWSLAIIHWGCRILVNRFESNTSLPPSLVESEPSGQSPEHHWSVDIGLRFLSDLIRKATAASAEDQLVQVLKQLAARWPYSSVGTEVAWDEARVNIILNNRSLTLSLLDRIHERKDTYHAQHPLLKTQFEVHVELPIAPQEGLHS